MNTMKRGRRHKKEQLQNGSIRCFKNQSKQKKSITLDDTQVTTHDAKQPHGKWINGPLKTNKEKDLSQRNEKRAAPERINQVL